MKQFFRFIFLVMSLWVAGLVLGACGDEPRPGIAVATPTAPPTTNFEGLRPTPVPPFQAVPNITVEPTTEAGITPVPTASVPPASPTLPPPTPVLKPTPTAPREDILTADDLGIGAWTDTAVLWSPTGDTVVLQVRRENSDSDFVFLVRPPASIQASFKLPKSAFATATYSPDGRFVSYIEKENEAQAGAVVIIDTRKDFSRTRRAYAGPCTNANWQAAGKLIAACGVAIYLLDDELEPNATITSPELIYKLDNNKLPGVDADLSLIFNALPSPDGSQIAFFALRRQSNASPAGEIAFYNPTTRRLAVLDRANRAALPLEWTPDSKFLVLRNITSDWTIAYTFDFYLADPEKLKITRNLTATNEKCDPLLGAKPDCQGSQPSALQSSSILFAPSGDRFFVTGLRYITRPGQAITRAERLSAGKWSAGKPEQLLETLPGDNITGLSWLPNGRYFYSVASPDTAARAYLDGKLIELKRNTGLKSNTPVPVATRSGSAINGFSFAQVADNTPVNSVAPPAPKTTVAPPTPTKSASLQPTATKGTAAPAPKTPAATVANGTKPPPTTPKPTTSGELPAGSVATVVPLPTQTLPPEVFEPVPVVPVPEFVAPKVPTATPEPTPVPLSIGNPLTVGYFMSPTANWVVALERIAPNDKLVQYQIRLLPYTLK